MSKTFDADSLFEPIEVKLGGKTYLIESITYDQMAEVGRVTEQRARLEAQRDEEGAVEVPENSVLDLQLSIYLGCSAEELRGVDVRRKMATARFIRQCINEATEEKNELAATES